MNRPSQDRWSTGKRGARQREKERLGRFYASRRWVQYEKELGQEAALQKMKRSIDAYFGRSPNLRRAVFQGVKNWIESHPMDF